MARASASSLEEKNVVVTHADLRSLFGSVKGRTMLSGRKLRRAFWPSPQRINEEFSNVDYAIHVHEKGLRGIAKPIGSLAIRDGHLVVTYFRGREPQTLVLQRLANSVADELKVNKREQYRA